jgi:glucose uptake protein GlcU
MVSLLDGCSEGCGWAAAILAALSWGTFGVPIKCNVNVEVNFFVMQSYKTLVCFTTCWLVLLLGEPVRWSSWGIVSGLFWVPGAACGIYGIRNAGVAVAVGTWASIQVVSSCIFGIVIFKEQVKDVQQTMMAFTILMAGLIGMSRYSESPPKELAASSSDYQRLSMNDNSSEDVGVFVDAAPKLRKAPKSGSISIPATMIEAVNEDMSSVSSIHSDNKRNNSISPSRQTSLIKSTSTISPMELEDGDPTSPLLLSDGGAYNDKNRGGPKERLFFFGGRLVLTRRQSGIAGAVVNGAWGGLNLIPLHYAQRDQGLSGASYLISYATGSLLVCASIWVGMFVYYYIKKDKNVHDAVASLPAWHVKELGLPGLYAGLFYSLGNFCSILAVTYLGQGVGFSFCQLQLLISGLWGVFYFKEIQGRETIMKGFSSAIVTIIGIIWLSYQHEGGAAHR